MKTALEKRLARSLKRLGVSRTARLVIGVSGGADSTALADAVQRIAKGGLGLAHLNHLLRGAESDDDEQFVRTFALQRDLEIIVERHDIAALARSEKRNLEAVARERRYAFLARAAREYGAGFVATAHTRDDQVETVCMRLLRGTGPEGLRGIYASRVLESDVVLVRPLLDVTRDEVIEHCVQYQLDYRTDSSNLTSDFARNRVRHELLPSLRSFNPRFDEALLRTAAIVADDDDRLNLEAQRLAAEVVLEANRLDLRRLRDEHPSLIRRVLRLWLRGARGDLRRIDTVHLMALERLIVKGQSGRLVELPGNLNVVRRLDSLFLELEKTNDSVESLSPRPRLRQGKS